MKNPACYLSGYSPCDAKLSGDHLISKSLLSQLGDNAVYIEGLPWCKGLKRVGVNSITGRVLCRLHNSQLSDFDSSASLLFRCLHQLPKRIVETEQREECVVNGLNVERWMLKTAATLLASGNATRNGQVIRSSLNPTWPSILMRKADFSEGCGLFLERPACGTTEMMPEFTIRLNWMDEECVGVTTSFLGFVFHLHTKRVESGSDYLYRPGGMIFQRGNVEKVMAIHYGSAQCGQAPIIKV
ncbi:hypothetical protein [Aromatoleum diolicum]|uniref:Uncharacterized protein n=1 Tax=Aromatoleum diolicum TaxID=75796 RepID=A0ABX1Q717_9RHOO|nr:hypothetical protein [Aromatoleum diolicum]NMG73325.1 hypothetical protein [Aromatoleum diolicum]